MGEAQPETIRLRLRVRGRVQGVWFRGWTRQQALVLGVAGFARNLDDGSVEVVAQGDREAAEALLGACRTGPPSARVDTVTAVEEAAGDGFDGFRIL